MLGGDSLHSMQLLAPILLHDYFEHSISQKTADGLKSMFPELVFFGLALLVSSGTMLMSSNMGSGGSLHMGLVAVDEDKAAKDAAADGNDTGGGVRYTILPPEHEGSMLCLPIRLPAAWRGSQGGGDLAQQLSTLPNERRQYVAQGGALGMLVLVVSTAKQLEQYLAQLACFAQLLAPHLLRSEVLRRTQLVSEQLRDKGGTLVGPACSSSSKQREKQGQKDSCSSLTDMETHSSGQNGILEGSTHSLSGIGEGVTFEEAMLKLDGRLATAIREILQKLLVHTRNGRKKGDANGSAVPVVGDDKDSVLWVQNTVGNGALHTGANGQVDDSMTNGLPSGAMWFLSSNGVGLALGSSAGPPGPCVRPLGQDVFALLVEVLRAAEAAPEQTLAAINDLNATQAGEVPNASDEGSEEEGAPRPGTIILPGPDELQGDVSQLRPEDRWFEHNWLWLNFKDVELDRRYNWWHNRQCVKLDSGLCWFWFTLLVVLLTVEPFSLANFHPNAFALAFLIVPGVYILHRWDTDWYIKRRHAVIIVQTTYYLVYNVIFIAPVFMVVKPPHVLRRPLWLLRVTGVDCMLMQLCFQLPFEKFFWLGILHLGIISSLQRSICDQLYADLPGARCGLLISSIQVFLGFVVTMAIAWRWEKARRKAFLKHVRAERPDPAAMQRRPARQVKKSLRTQDVSTNLQRSLVQQVRH